jgi:proline iminopeptidase
VLLNPAPASHRDYLLLRQDRFERAAEDMEKLKGRTTDADYQAGDPDTVAAYYRIHFRTTLRRPRHLEQVIRRLRVSFTRQGILKARAIEARLMRETWLAEGYDLLPRLRQLNTPALVVHGEHDLVPVECAAHIAQAIPGARFVQLKDCGHFSFLECPKQVYSEIVGFFL